MHPIRKKVKNWYCTFLDITLNLWCIHFLTRFQVDIKIKTCIKTGDIFASKLCKWNIYTHHYIRSYHASESSFRFISTLPSAASLLSRRHRALQTSSCSSVNSLLDLVFEYFYLIAIKMWYNNYNLAVYLTRVLSFQNLYLLNRLGRQQQTTFWTMIFLMNLEMLLMGS